MHHVKGISVFQLRHQGAAAADGPLHELGEEADKEQVLREALLCLAALPVDVEKIAGGLKGVEGDPEREQGPRQAEVYARQEIEKGDHKGRILQIGEDAKIKQQGNGHCCPLLPRGVSGADPGGEGRK